MLSISLEHFGHENCFEIYSPMELESDGNFALVFATKKQINIAKTRINLGFSKYLIIFDYRVAAKNTSMKIRIEESCYVILTLKFFAKFCRLSAPNPMPWASEQYN